MAPTDLIPTEPLTVILSRDGWIRSAKGHDFDESKLKFKAGDQLLSVAFGRSDQQVVILDSTGRTYALQAHALPSARGQGEPVTGRLSIPPDAMVCDALMGDADDRVLMASDAGYGFIASMSDLHTKNRNGKVVLTLPDKALPLKPIRIEAMESALLAAITNEGRMLLFPIKDLPTLARGKGNKIINISPRRAKAREELLQMLFLMPPDSQLVIYSGKRHFTLKDGNLAGYIGARGLRGKKLPRGYQKVDRYEIIPRHAEPAHESGMPEEK
jgi:topoisomerase-4 subunit A